MFNRVIEPNISELVMDIGARAEWSVEDFDKYKIVAKYFLKHQEAAQQIYLNRSKYKSENDFPKDKFAQHYLILLTCIKKDFNFELCKLGIAMMQGNSECNTFAIDMLSLKAFDQVERLQTFAQLLKTGEFDVNVKTDVGNGTKMSLAQLICDTHVLRKKVQLAWFGSNPGADYPELYLTELFACKNLDLSAALADIDALGKTMPVYERESIDAMVNKVLKSQELAQKSLQARTSDSGDMVAENSSAAVEAVKPRSFTR